MLDTVRNSRLKKKMFLLDLPYDLQYDIFRRASVLQTYHYAKEKKQIKLSVANNNFYHSYVYGPVFTAHGLAIRKGAYVLFHATPMLLSYLDALSRTREEHGKKLNFALRVQMKWTDMPPITRRVLGASTGLATFNVLLPEAYHLFIFEDVWRIHDNVPKPDENPGQDITIHIMDIIRRMKEVGLADDRILVNNLLVDLFEQNRFAFQSLRNVSNDDAVTYLAWILWWHGNWRWNIRYNEFHALVSKYTEDKFTIPINHFALACLMANA